MKIVLVTQTTTLAKYFHSLTKNVQAVSPALLDETLDSISAETMLWFDASCVPRESLLETIKRISIDFRGQWAVIDANGAIADPALLLFMGAQDYVSPAMYDGAYTRLRFEKAQAFRSRETEAQPTVKRKAREERGESFPGWDNLRAGKDYSFYFVYAAIGDTDQVRRKIGESGFSLLKQEFLALMESIFAEFDGRVWINDGQSALILLPNDMDSAENLREPNPVGACIRTLLDHVILSYDEFHLDIPVNFRFALHKGSIPWQEPGKTGTIVSESVNFIHHFANKYGHDATIHITKEAWSLIPPHYRGLFRGAGQFEGRDILCMRKFKI